MTSFLIDPVVVTDFPSTIKRFNGDDVSITCTATGKPKPSSIEWQLNGTTISSIDRITITNEDIDELTISSTLNINPVYFNDMGNNYTCISSNVIPSGIVMDSSSFSIDGK